MDIKVAKQEFLNEIKKLMERYQLSQTKDAYYFEPDMMEHLEQYYGYIDDTEKEVTIRTDVKGLRYEGRTKRLDRLSIGDPVSVYRECDNQYNANNFKVCDMYGNSLGNLPAKLCDAMAPLYDQGLLTFEKNTACYIERIQDRSRYARQGILFIEMIMRFHDI